MLSFLGQFLVEKGVVDEGQLAEALQLMEETNQFIGEIAVSNGLLPIEEADGISDGQRGRDLYYGEIAVEKGCLSSDQVRELLALQQSSHIRIGEALVQLGHLTEERLAEALSCYQREQAAGRTDSDVADRLADRWLVKWMVEYFPKLVLRIARIPAKVGNAVLWRKEGAFDHQAAIAIGGSEPLVVGLGSSRGQARDVTEGMFHTKEDELHRELMDDTVMEVLNIMGGNVIGPAAKEGISVDLGFPESGTLPDHGIAFPTVTPDGDGVLVFSQAD